MTKTAHILACFAETLPPASTTLVTHQILSDDILFAQRERLENDPRFRQILPYVVVTLNGLIGAYRRKSSGEEARLHHKFSVGFGGHVDLADQVLDATTSVPCLEATLKRAAYRELYEELGISAEMIANLTVTNHLIIANDTAVDRVHTAIITRTELQTSVQEVDLHLEHSVDWLGFLPANVLEQTANAETWTRILLESNFFK